MGTSSTISAGLSDAAPDAADAPDADAAAHQAAVNAAARKAAKRYRRRSRIAVGCAFLVILLITGGVAGLGYWKTHDKPKYDVPQHAAKLKNGLVAGGSGPVRVDVYVDYDCAQCANFATTAGPTLDKLIATNAITLVYHPLSVDNQVSSTAFSARAASSVTCASNLGALLAYSNLLFAYLPRVTDIGLSNDSLVHIAGRAGIINPAFAQCLRAGTYNKWVATQNAAATRAHLALPAVMVNGKAIGVRATAPSVAALMAAVRSAGR